MSSRPYGSWSSPIDSARVASANRRLAQPRFDGGHVYWLEARPEEGGRQVVMRRRAVGPAGPLEEASPPGADVRTRVHEYGGGEYTVRDGALFFSDAEEGRLVRCRPGGAPARPLTPAGTGARYADLEVSPDGRWLVAVEERPREGREPENRLVVLPADGGGVPRAVAAGSDFVSFPRFSPDGARLAFTAWDHPAMPWDGTRLCVLDWGADGPAGAPRALFGGPSESIFQPAFSPAGHLTFASDRSGWWNLYQLRGDRAVPLCPRPAEFGLPQWVFGLSTYAFLDEEEILCTYSAAGERRLARLRVANGGLRDLDVPHRSIEGLRAADGRACYVGAGAAHPSAVCLLEADGRVRELRSSGAAEVDAAFLALPEAVEFPSAGGARTHAFLYRPTHPRARGPAGERPPLLVKSHGGPTGAAGPGLDLRIQYWTSRGFAVADVDYRGSTGYGRAYREQLRGAWGVADVDDCTAAVAFAAAGGRADPARAAITGGSAGGYTTLCALTFRDVFRAGASHYGIGDLEALARDTHKFESRYLEGLVGPYPEQRDLYRERSPLHHTDRLSCPVIFFQGLDDPVVPPNQAEAMVAALARRGLPHAYVPFPGERHGFRRAENIRTALEGELFFYARIFGFEVDVRPEAVHIVW